MSRLPIRWTVKTVRPYIDSILLTSPNVEGEETITIHLGTKKVFATRHIHFKDSKHYATALYEEYHEVMDTLKDSDRSLVYDALRSSSSNDIENCFKCLKNLQLERKSRSC